LGLAVAIVDGEPAARVLAAHGRKLE
jgi:hypothetical protein